MGREATTEPHRSVQGQNRSPGAPLRSHRKAGIIPANAIRLKSRARPADASGMAEISGLNASDATAVAVEMKNREHMRALQQGMIKLIEGATAPARPLPPDATFSTYA